MTNSKIASLVGKDLSIEFSGRKDSLAIVDWSTIDETSSEYEDIQVYFMDDVCIDKVLNDELVPFGLLGLCYNPESFAEVNNGGLLLFDREGSIHFHSHGKFEQIAKSFDQLKIIENVEEVSDDDTHLNPPYSQIWESARGFEKHKDFQNALLIIGTLHQALPLNRTVAVHLAELFIKTGQYQEASSIADKMLTKESSYIPALNLKGNALIGLGKFPEALACAEQIVAQEDSDDFFNDKIARGFALRAVILAKTGQGDLGKEDIKKALDIDLLVGLEVPGFDELANKPS